MLGKFLFLLIRTKWPVETWESILDFTFSLRRCPSLYKRSFLWKVQVEHVLAWNSRIFFIISMTVFFFSNLVNSLFSSKTTLTHAIRGFPLCQQRGLLELGNKLDYFSAILRKRRSQSWGIFRMSNWKTAGAHHPKIKPLISDKHLIQASQYFLGLIEVFTSLLPTSWVNRKREPEVVLHSCLFKANIWDLKKKNMIWSSYRCFPQWSDCFPPFWNFASSLKMCSWKVCIKYSFRETSTWNRSTAVIIIVH